MEIDASRSAFVTVVVGSAPCRLGVGAAVIDYDNHDADVAKSRERARRGREGAWQATLARSVEEERRKEERGMEWQVGGREGRRKGGIE